MQRGGRPSKVIFNINIFNLLSMFVKVNCLDKKWQGAVARGSWVLKGEMQDDRKPVWENVLFAGG